MKYRFKWKKKYFWRSHIVVGHRFEKEMNKMVLYFEDGSIREISEWCKCEAFLGKDWALALKEKMEQEIGQKIPISIKG